MRVAIRPRTATAAVAGQVEYAGPMDGPDASRRWTAELTVIATGIGRVVELDTDALPILPTGELYEVWFVAPDDTPGRPNRISAGTFHPDPDGRSHVRSPPPSTRRGIPVVEITAEPGDGDPLPTGPVRARVDPRALIAEPHGRVGRKLAQGGAAARSMADHLQAVAQPRRGSPSVDRRS